MTNLAQRARELIASGLSERKAAIKLKVSRGALRRALAAADDGAKSADQKRADPSRRAPPPAKLETTDEVREAVRASLANTVAHSICALDVLSPRVVAAAEGGAPAALRELARSQAQIQDRMIKATVELERLDAAMDAGPEYSADTSLPGPTATPAPLGAPDKQPGEGPNASA